MVRYKKLDYVKRTSIVRGGVRGEGTLDPLPRTLPSP